MVAFGVIPRVREPCPAQLPAKRPSPSAASTLSGRRGAARGRLRQSRRVRGRCDSLSEDRSKYPQRGSEDDQAEAKRKAGDFTPVALALARTHHRDKKSSTDSHDREEGATRINLHRPQSSRHSISILEPGPSRQSSRGELLPRDLLSWDSIQ